MKTSIKGYAPGGLVEVLRKAEWEEVVCPTFVVLDICGYFLELEENKDFVRYGVSVKGSAGETFFAEGFSSKEMIVDFFLGTRPVKIDGHRLNSKKKDDLDLYEITVQVIKKEWDNFFKKYPELLVKAVKVFKDEIDAREWFASPTTDLGDITPIEYVTKEWKIGEVKALLVKIERNLVC